jgi:hypothetical protein
MVSLNYSRKNLESSGGNSLEGWLTLPRLSPERRTGVLRDWPRCTFVTAPSVASFEFSFHCLSWIETVVPFTSLAVGGASGLETRRDRDAVSFGKDSSCSGLAIFERMFEFVEVVLATADERCC